MDHTSKERVLVHLYLRRFEEGWDGGVSHQEMISRECGVGRTHVPRVIKPLLAEDLIKEALGRAPGHLRRIKVYSLTREGELKASRIVEDLESRRVVWEGPAEEKLDEPLTDALRHINDALGGSRSIKMPDLMRLTGGQVSWADVLDIADSRVEEGGLEIPPGWEVLEGPARPGTFIGREEEVREVHSLIAGSAHTILSGEKGMGKRTLIAHIAQVKGLKVMWLRRDPNANGLSIKVRAPDLIAILEDAGQSILSRLMDEDTEIADPRDDTWPEKMRSALLVRIVDAEVENGSYVLKGLGRDDFMGRCVGLGMGRELSEGYHRASKGSPGSIAYLLSLDRSELEGIVSGEDPIFHLILGMRRI
ncbi:MAG: ATP-binding protein [Thermoplasmata archaeon]|nr:ATP-binding protein [Thermoplasmata archaeon]